MIADPVQLYDCCPTSDGAAAVVVTTRDRARNAPGSSTLRTGRASVNLLDPVMVDAYGQRDRGEERDEGRDSGPDADLRAYEVGDDAADSAEGSDQEGE